MERAACLLREGPASGRCGGGWGGAGRWWGVGSPRVRLIITWRLGCPGASPPYKGSRGPGRPPHPQGKGGDSAGISEPRGEDPGGAGARGAWAGTWGGGGAAVQRGRRGGGPAPPPGRRRDCRASGASAGSAGMAKKRRALPWGPDPLGFIPGAPRQVGAEPGRRVLSALPGLLVGGWGPRKRFLEAQTLVSPLPVPSQQSQRAKASCEVREAQARGLKGTGLESLCI